MKKQSHTPCIADDCGKTPTDRCHIKSKGAGGEFTEENTIQLCRSHHQNQHALGWDRFLAKFPAVALELKRKGFEIQNIFGIRKLVKI